MASRLGLLDGSVRHYGLNTDVNSVILMADIVLYGSDQDVQGFPPLLVRAMTFGIPIIAPDFPILKKYVSPFMCFLVASVIAFVRGASLLLFSYICKAVSEITGC